MNHRLRKVVDLLELARPELVLAAVSNSWVVLILSLHVEPAWRQNAALRELPLWAALALAATVSAGLVIYALAINDLLDVKHDRLFARHRPLPAGRLQPTTAVVLATLGLLAALFAAVFMGEASMLLCLFAAVGVLFYNTAGKYLPATGVVTLGLICALNMLVPVPLLGFTWPVWLAMTHVMGCAALVHHVGGKRPRLLGERWWLLWAGWAFWTLALVGTMSYRDALVLHDRPTIWLGPIVAGCVFLLLSYRVLAGSSHASQRERRDQFRAYGRVAVLWLIVYDAGWVLSAGLYLHALLFAALFIAALGLVHCLTALGELASPAPGYRVRQDPSSS